MENKKNRVIKKPTVRVEEKELLKIKEFIKEKRDNVTFQDYVMYLIRKDMCKHDKH